jgi:tRNA threonylcarbamoyladenosine biosynthesis protein TsaE
MTGQRQVTVETAAGMRALGVRLAGLLRAGDLVILSGSLGAGKTTLVQGIGEGLGVRGPVTSPTFVIARVHPSLTGGPDLVHADAYRLASPAEVDDLDLDEAMDSSVTVVEWGGGLAEGLAEDRLEVTITPAGAQAAPDAPEAEPRTVCFAGHGGRWNAVGDSALLALPGTSEAL